jgi:hypothetical protein
MTLITLYYAIAIIATLITPAATPLIIDDATLAIDILMILLPLILHIAIITPLLIDIDDIIDAIAIIASL